MDKMDKTPSKSDVLPLKNVFKYFLNMRDNQIIFVYQGDVTSDLVTSVLGMMENKLDHIGEVRKVKKKVFNVMVECLQNLYYHIDIPEDAPIERAAILMVGKQSDSYFIITGNPIQNESVSIVKNKLEQINKSTKQELKQLYKDILSNAKMSDKGTAGLGMIDMARKSGEKLGFDFYPLNKYYSFFCLEARVSRI